MATMAVAHAGNLCEMSPSTKDELLTVDQAAKVLSVTPKSVRAYVRRGWLEATQVYDPATRRYKIAVTRASVSRMKDGQLFPRPPS
jgi:hypothetical protein